MHRALRRSQATLPVPSWGRLILRLLLLLLILIITRRLRSVLHLRLLLLTLRPTIDIRCWRLVLPHHRRTLSKRHSSGTRRGRSSLCGRCLLVRLLLLLWLAVMRSLLLQHGTTLSKGHPASVRGSRLGRRLEVVGGTLRKHRRSTVLLLHLRRICKSRNAARSRSVSTTTSLWLLPLRSLRVRGIRRRLPPVVAAVVRSPTVSWA
mmetsp:Transcript_118293/g.341958  ORF Transcript_118293/g.341958 Transcript_118293/m.341958 type:complete len:206 (-) Transcript_118293:438-1055(-)